MYVIISECLLSRNVKCLQCIFSILPLPCSPLSWQYSFLHSPLQSTKLVHGNTCVPEGLGGDIAGWLLWRRSEFDFKQQAVPSILGSVLVLCVDWSRIERILCCEKPALAWRIQAVSQCTHWGSWSPRSVTQSVCLQLAGGHGLKEGAVSKQPAGSDSILWLLEWKTVVWDGSEVLSHAVKHVIFQITCFTWE